MSRWVKGIFPQFEDIKTTVGAAFTVKSYDLSGFKIYLQIWDFAGQSRFTKFMYSLINGAKAGLLVFDLSNLLTLDVIENFWIPNITEILKIDLSKKGNPFILVGNKMDLMKDSEALLSVLDEIERVKSKYNLEYISISAKSGENVDKLEKMILAKIKKVIPLPVY